MSLDSDPWEELLQVIYEGVHQLEVSRYSAIALFSLSIYDWLLCLADEMELIYRARWTLIKVTYLICRYYPLLVGPVFMVMWLGDHTFETCEGFIHPFYVLIVPCQVAAQAVMILRAHGFTAHNKIYLIILVLALGAVTAAQLWLFGTQFSASTDQYFAFGPKTACFGNDSSTDNLQTIYISNMNPGLVMLGSFLIDLLVIVFVLLHSFRIRSSQGRLGQTFLLQALIFFIVMAAVNLLTAVTYFQRNKTYNGFGLPFAFLLPPIIACRIVLQLRRLVTPTETHELREQSQVVREAFELLVIQDVEAPSPSASPTSNTFLSPAQNLKPSR